MKRKTLYLIDGIIIIATLVGLLGIFSYAQPMLIAPLDEHSTTETSVLFEFERAEVILLDDNLQFSSPEEIFAEDRFVIRLEPGIYYWKARGAVDSDVRTLTIASEVELMIRANGDKYELVNGGNVPLDVEIYDGDKLIGRTTLGSDEKQKAEGNKFVGRERE